VTCNNAQRARERSVTMMDDAQLDDGRYDAFVVWAEARDDGRIACDLTITSGAHKGEVLTVLARATGDPIALVGISCNLVVENGQPRITRA
jgi:hypothetical protein